MKSHADKGQENRSRAAAERSKKASRHLSAFQFVDNRPEAIAQRKLQEIADNSPQVRQLKGLQQMVNISPPIVAQYQQIKNTYNRGTAQNVVQKENGEPPWDTLARWVEDGDYEQYTPTIRRIAKPPSNDVSVDYDIEFTWANALYYDGDTYDVMAHLHVRGGVPQPGGVWATGLHDTGMNWNTIPYYNYFSSYMSHYVE